MSAASYIGMTDVKRHVNIFVVSERSFVTQSVSASHFSMIGRVENDRAVSEPQCVEFIEKLNQLRVDGPDTVHVEVIEAAPSLLLGRDVTKQGVPALLILAMRTRPARLVKRLGQALRN